MKPMETNQKMLTMLSVLPSDRATGKWKRVLNIIFPAAVLIAHLCAIVASALFFEKFVSEDLDRAIFAILQIGGHLNMVYMLVIALILRHRINGIFGSLTAIYKTREH